MLSRQRHEQRGLAGTKAIGVNPPMWSLSLEFWAYFIALFAACAITGLRSRNVGQRATAGHICSRSDCSCFLCGPPTGCIPILFLLDDRGFAVRAAYLAQPVGWLLGALVVLGGVSLVRCMKLSEDWNLLFENGEAGIWGIPIKGALLVLSALLVSAGPTDADPSALRATFPFLLYPILFHYPLLCLAFSIFHLDYLEWSSASRGVFLLGLTFGILGGAIGSQACWKTSRLEHMV